MTDVFNHQEAFGQLRSMLHQTATRETFVTLTALLRQALDHDAALVKAQWLPYIDHYIHNFHKNYPPVQYIDAYSWDWFIYDPLFLEADEDKDETHWPHPEVQLRHIQTFPLAGVDEEIQCTWLRTIEMPFLKQLSEIDTTEKDIFEAALHGPNAKHLELINANQLGIDYVLEILQTLPEPLTRLKSLTLHNCEITPQKLTKLGQLKGIPALQRLDIHNNEVGDEGIAALVDTALWQQLTHIGLNNVELGDVGLKAIINKEKRIPLKYIALNNNVNISSKALYRIAQAPHLLDLTFLDISDIFDDESIIDTLVQIPFTMLDRLHITSLNLSKEAMNKLGQWESLKTVRHLSLYKTNQNSKTIKALLQHDTVSNLRYLDVDENNITRTALKIIAKSNHLRRLEALEIGWVEIEVVDLHNILDTSKLESLRFLITEDYDIPDPTDATIPFKYKLERGDEAYFGAF